MSQMYPRFFYFAKIAKSIKEALGTFSGSCISRHSIPALRELHSVFGIGSSYWMYMAANSEICGNDQVLDVFLQSGPFSGLLDVAFLVPFILQSSSEFLERVPEASSLKGAHVRAKLSTVL